MLQTARYALCVMIALSAMGCEATRSVTAVITEPVKKVVQAPVQMVFGSEEIQEESLTLIEPSEAYRVNFTPVWTASLSTPRGARIESATLLDDLLICVERPTNLVTALEVRSGLVRWQKVVGSKLDIVFTPVRYSDDKLLINTETELITLAADSGRLLLRSSLESAVKDRPVLINDYAVFGGLNGNVFAHHVTAGYSFWSYRMTGGIVVRPVAAGLNVFVADSNGVYAMLLGTNRQVQWKGRTYSTNSATPVINNIAVFLASEDQTLYAINRLTGKDIWKFRSDAPLTRAPVLIGNTIYQNERGIGLAALDALTGKELWTHPTQGEPVTISSGRLLVHEPGRIVALDPPSGKPVAQVTVAPLKMILSGPGGSLLLISENGRLTRLDLQR